MKLTLTLAILAQLFHGSLEHLPRRGLTRAGSPHDHVTVPGNLAVENLDNLGDPIVHHLQPHLSALALQHRLQVTPSLLRELDTREQVTEQRAEQREVHVHQLGHDQVLHRAV